MAPVIFQLHKENIPFKICVTGQHREMLDQVLYFFQIKPDYDLDLMKDEQTLNGISSAIFRKIDIILDKERPDLVLVHGDTTTAAIIAQAAFYRRIKVGHVEAGLRTYNKTAPFPEEMNRQIIGRIAEINFAPTARAYSNLLNEQIPEKNILMTGNTVVDSLEWVRQKISSSPSAELEEISAMLNTTKQLILVTGHRRENQDGGLEEVAEALLRLAENPLIEIVYPVHLNPRVKKPIYEILKDWENVHLIAPVSYPIMIWLMTKASVIISDSGGIQEEAPSFGKNVLVTRNFTERPEGVEAGFSILTGTNKTRIIDEANRLLKEPLDLRNKPNPYGDGKAAERIVTFLKNWRYF